MKDNYMENMFSVCCPICFHKPVDIIINIDSVYIGKLPYLTDYFIPENFGEMRILCEYCKQGVVGHFSNIKKTNWIYPERERALKICLNEFKKKTLTEKRLQKLPKCISNVVKTHFNREI